MLQLAQIPVPANEGPYGIRLFHGFLTCRVIHALDNLGFFEAIDRRDRFRPSEVAGALDVPIEHLDALLAYLENAGILRKKGDECMFPPGVRDGLADGLGFIQWLVGAYGSVLDQLEGLTRGHAIYGRDVLRCDPEVARSSTTIGRVHTDPFIHEMLRIDGIRTIADIGTGSALRLIDICARFPSIRAIGIDISPDCCEVARRNVAQAGLEDRIVIVQARAEEWLAQARDRGLWRIDLVLCCAMFHDLLNHAGLAETFLAEVLKGLRPGAYVLIQDQMRLPVERRRVESWVPGFELVHHLMGQRLFLCSSYEEVFASVGLDIVRKRETSMPGSWIYLLRVPSGARRKLTGERTLEPGADPAHA
jgi:SAM-dependent methyltransferase